MKLNTYFVRSTGILLILLSAFIELGFCRVGGLIKLKKFGGVEQCRSIQDMAEIESIGRFAVEEYNAKENALLEFSRVIKSAERVAAGTVYYLTLETIEAGKKKIYVAQVWVKPWMNFRELMDFEHSDDDVTTSNCDIAELFN